MNSETGLEVAVIGMTVRFPGAKNIEEFWKNIRNGVESIAFFAEEELLAEGIKPDQLHNPDYVKCGGGLLENKEYFDASFFGYSAVEAEMMDPQLRIFHECSWHALEHAGYDPFSYDGLIGLYAGASFNIFWEAAAFIAGRVDVLGAFATGLLIDRDYLCTRVSYTLNLKGPSVVVKTACSTSLVAVHMACQAILNGECDIALAGGVTITRLSKAGYLYMEDMIASLDGHCRVFDARANGTLPGDGIGIVVLKRLQDAIDEGDAIYAIIKGTAINNDGIRKAGYTAPSITGQCEVIQDALHLAEVNPETISYVECHGTGTVVGDPIEIEALKRAFNTDKKRFCAIGSVKSNLGHLDSAAGVVSLIKTILALKHKLIPPSLHFETPNPKIDFENSPFYVNNRLIEWKPNGHPLRAGVSSFGIGGTNAHMVLEEWPDEQNTGQKTQSEENRAHQLLLLSAKTKNALERLSENLVIHLKENPGINLADAAYTLKVGRRVFPHRRMVVSATVNEAIEALSTTDSGRVRSSYTKDEKKSPIFMFAGLGSQYVNMGLGLYQEVPYFREEMDRCLNILKSLLEFDIKQILYPSSVVSVSKNKEINQTQIGQLVVFIFEYALAKLLMQWGIKPHAMIGYSLGEYTAACIAGAFSLEDVLKLLVTRGRLISSIPTGTMLSVPLPAQQLKPYLTGELTIAIDNGPSCIIAGAEKVLDKFQGLLKEKRYLCMRLPNSHAIHSKMMCPILKEFEKNFRYIKRNKPQIPYISNLTGQWITVEEVTTPSYWSQHMREMVRFSDGIKQLLKEPNPIFIEIGPGRDLSTLLVRHKEENPETLGLGAVNLIRSQQQEVPDDYYLLRKVGQLWLYGLKIDWEAFCREEKSKRIPLPLYPFENRRYWFEGNPFQARIERKRQNSLPTRSKENIVESEEIEDKIPLYQRPELDTPYVAPSNETEQLLTKTWQKFFGIEFIGIDDDFIDLGGDSLKATLVVSMLYRELKLRIPVVEVFNQLTIRKLAQYICKKERKNPGPTDEHMFLLKENSNHDRHLFIVHDGTGEIQSYFDFCSRLTCDINTWAIKAEKIKHYAPVNLTIEKMAEEYIGKIKKICPHGPYYIAGWSFGGRLAYEMVRQLEQDSQEVKFLAIIDVPAPQKIQTQVFDFSVETESNWISKCLPEKEIKEKKTHITGLEQFWPLVVEYLEENQYTIEDLKQVVPRDMPQAIPNFERLTIGELIYHLNMIRTFARAERFYLPTGKINTPTYLFEANASEVGEEMLQWSDFCSNLVKTYKIPGDHFTIFRTPNVALFAEMFDGTMKDIK